jgi:tetratricopeptide (TPR) repeat protein
MTVTQKQAILMTIGLLIVLIAAFGGYKYFTAKVPVPAREVLSGKPELETSYDRAIKFETMISEKPGEIQNYLALGSAWKLIGDATRDEQWYKLSLDAYKRGISITNRKNSLLLTNAGQIEEQLGNFSQAKSYYLESIDLSPGDTSYHLMYINLLRYKYKASPEQILAAYDVGMNRVLGGADLVSSRSQYLKSIGRYDDARRDLELLLKNKIIAQEQMDSEILEMKNLQEAAK